MDPSASPSPFSSPLSSPAKTPHSSPQKSSSSSSTLKSSPSNSSPISNSAPRYSPERQCACPCGPFKSELKAAITLMTFKHHPVPMLHPVAYPSDTETKQHIPVGDLCKYSKTHVWPDDVHCFCSLRPGNKERSVRIFVPSHGALKGSPCLGCTDWTPDGVGGCRYFVNLRELFDGSESLFGTEIIPLQNFPLRAAQRAQARRLLARSGVHSRKRSTTLSSAPANSLPSAPAVSRMSAPAASTSMPSAPGIQDYFPLTFGVKPGSVSDHTRIWSPPPPHDMFERVEKMALPSDSEVRDVFEDMLHGSGVRYRQFMAVIGGCIACDQVMALPNILTHPCVGHTEEPGPSPSKFPRLPEDNRALPTAASRLSLLQPRNLAGRESVSLVAGPSSLSPIKEEPSAGQASIKVEDHDDSDSEVEFVEDGHKGKRKRVKLEPPSQRVLLGPWKKPRAEKKGESSQTKASQRAIPIRTSTPVSKPPAEVVDLTVSPTAVPSTPVSKPPAEVVTFSPIAASTPVSKPRAEVVDLTVSPIAAASMPVSKPPAEVVDLTFSPIRVSTPISAQPARAANSADPSVRIVMPDGSRELYRDADEDFVMYEKA
uniref:Polyketide synthetase protein n=1 Tax=Ganoderma boninense TaxID=34458 RepID=A0A5K1K6Z4_9APHY|nr:Polyketide synthetase protein [Ganoderma boninense]